MTDTLTRDIEFDLQGQLVIDYSSVPTNPVRLE